MVAVQYVMAVEYRLLGSRHVLTKQFVGKDCGKQADKFVDTIQARKVLNPISKAWEIVQPAKAEYHAVFSVGMIGR